MHILVVVGRPPHNPPTLLLYAQALREAKRETKAWWKEETTRVRKRFLLTEDDELRDDGTSVQFASIFEWVLISTAHRAAFENGTLLALKRECSAQAMSYGKTERKTNTEEPMIRL